MKKPQGGRGQKAPYESVMVRTPVPIKDEVESLIARYRESVLSGVELSKTESDGDFDACLKLVYRFIRESGQTDKLHTRNNVNLIKFCNWLESLANRNSNL